jgi:hypothetical protein
VRVPSIGFSKQSLGRAMPLLFKIGRIAYFAVALQLYPNDSLTCRDDPGNEVPVGLFAATVENGMFGARVLVEEKIVTPLILDGLVDEIMNLLRREGCFGVLLVFMLRLAWRQRRRPGSVNSHPRCQNGQQTEANLYMLPHPDPHR